MASSASSVLPRIATATRNTLRSFTSASNARPVSAEDAIHGLQIVFLPHRLFWRLCAHDIRQDYRSNGFNERDTMRDMLLEEFLLLRDLYSGTT